MQFVHHQCLCVPFVFAKFILFSMRIEKCIDFFLSYGSLINMYSSSSSRKCLLKQSEAQVLLLFMPSDRFLILGDYVVCFGFRHNSNNRVMQHKYIVQWVLWNWWENHFHKEAFSFPLKEYHEISGTRTFSCWPRLFLTRKPLFGAHRNFMFMHFANHVICYSMLTCYQKMVDDRSNNRTSLVYHTCNLNYEVTNSCWFTRN